MAKSRIPKQPKHLKYPKKPKSSASNAVLERYLDRCKEVDAKNKSRHSDWLKAKTRIESEKKKAETLRKKVAGLVQKKHK